MQRQAMNFRWPRELPARMLAGLALLAFAITACGPQVPALVTAAPSLAPVHVVSVTSTGLVPSPSAAPPATATPARAATLAPGASPTLAATAGVAVRQLLPTPDDKAASRQVNLPILMYHYVEPWPPGAGELRQNLTVQPADFAAEMAYLHAQGYVTVSLYDLMAALALGQPLPRRAVVLTFDDGYRTLFDYAAPAMAPYGYTGTVFVVTQLMDENFTQYLTWPQAEALYAAGWKIEPHTKTHALLAGADRAYQLYEMLGSMQTIQAHIGATPRFFAYPYGKWDDTTLALERELNLWAAVTEVPGAIHGFNDRYELHRVRINGTITMADFVRTIKATQ
jgi:peptidoglycan/xylan/chitin deacetylase (PgdA/CDA1 family)